MGGEKDDDRKGGESSPKPGQGGQGGGQKPGQGGEQKPGQGGQQGGQR